MVSLAPVTSIAPDGALPRLALAVRESPGRGRGVFALAFIPRGTVVDISPVLLFDADSYASHGRHTALDHYVYTWPGVACAPPQYALALGLGSIFNHRTTPTVGWMRDAPNRRIIYTALRDHACGEELFISYGQRPSWFVLVQGDDDADSLSDDGGDAPFAALCIGDTDAA